MDALSGALSNFAPCSHRILAMLLRKLQETYQRLPVQPFTKTVCRCSQWLQTCNICSALKETQRTTPQQIALLGHHSNIRGPFHVRSQVSLTPNLHHPLALTACLPSLPAQPAYPAQPPMHHHTTTTCVWMVRMLKWLWTRLPGPCMKHRVKGDRAISADPLQ